MSEGGQNSNLMTQDVLDYWRKLQTRIAPGFKNYYSHIVLHTYIVHNNESLADIGKAVSEEKSQGSLKPQPPVQPQQPL